MQESKGIVIAGGTGLIGSFLCPILARAGFEVTLLSRSKTPSYPFPIVQWDPARREIEEDGLPPCRAVINLSGASIGGKRWSAEYKGVLLRSRIDSTAFLNDLVRQQSKRPELFIGASAIGYYGDCGAQSMTEDDPVGQGFLADLSQQWENAYLSPVIPGVRQAILRIGLVLATEGGTLEGMLKGARFGIYPVFGNGTQYMSWIHIEDLCRMILHVIQNPEIEGIFNAVAPNPVTNRTFMHTLKSALGGIGVSLPVPKVVMKIALGEFAEFLFHSTNVNSDKMSNQGFQFLFPELMGALKDLLEK